MNAKSLMIGDWVEIQDTPKYYKVFGIDILAKGDACRLMFEDYVVDTWCDRVKPIPLTEEILKKNEFVSVSDNWDEQTHEVLVSWHKGNVKITLAQESMRAFCDVDDDDELVTFLTYHDGHNYDLDIAIEYVHELQHALRLCGLADVADNLKIE